MESSYRWGFLFLFVPVFCLSASTAYAQSKTYTYDNNFDKGVMLNVNHDYPNNHQLQLDSLTTPFPYIWIACSSRGSVVRIDVETGEILGEYWTSPTGLARNPSRTTVDQYGNVWVGNRNANYPSGGSVVKIGLVVGGRRVNADKSLNPKGEYLMPPFEYCTAYDRDGDGLIHTSRGLDDIFNWPDHMDGAGGNPAYVEDAEDECILIFQRTSGEHVRHVSVDSDNNVWVGCITTNKFDLLDGETGAILDSRTLSCGGYGGLIDGNGILWSGNYGLLRMDCDGGTFGCDSMMNCYYGMGIDRYGCVWISDFGTNAYVRKFDPSGAVLGIFHVYGSDSRGVAVTPKDNHIWIANTGSNDVTRLDNDGNLVKIISLGTGEWPTGVAVDSNGKVWVTNFSSNDAMRIDPDDDNGTVDKTVDLNSDSNPHGDANPYNYSDMTGMVAIGATVKQGTWDVVYDSGLKMASWGTVIWNEEPQGVEPSGTDIKVEVRAADRQTDLAAPGNEFEEVGNSAPFTGVIGRYVEIRATLSREAGITETPVLSDLTISPEYDLPGESHQEEFVNTLADTAYDLMKIIHTEYGSFTITDVITGEPFPDYDISYVDSTGDIYIHWKGDKVAPGDTAKACFEIARATKFYAPHYEVTTTIWTDENGDTLGKASPVVTGNFGYIDMNNTTVCTWNHTWVEWLGDGWPPEPPDSTGTGMGTIEVGDVYWCLAPRGYSLDELNSDRYTDPELIWQSLEGFTFNYGESVTRELSAGILPTDIVLVRYEMSGGGLSSSDFLQFPVSISTSPEWEVRYIDLFQDNFTESGIPDPTHFARVDRAEDLNPPENPDALPGDEAIVTVADPGDSNGVVPNILPAAGDGTIEGPAVYLYLRVWTTVPPAPTGAQMECPDDRASWSSVEPEYALTGKRFPHVGTVSAGGELWQVYRMDWYFESCTDVEPVEDKYCVDLMDIANGSHSSTENQTLNTGIFNPGDMVLYFFGAGRTGRATYWTRRNGRGEGFVTPSINVAAQNATYFTILPRRGLEEGNDILLVDAADDQFVADGSAEEEYFRSAFGFFEEFPGDSDYYWYHLDVYNVLGSSANAGNSLASRAKSVSQLRGDTSPIYRTIIWSSGSLETGTIGDGALFGPEKSRDYELLTQFLQANTNDPCLYLVGDNIAAEAMTLGPYAISFMNNYIGYYLLNGDHVNHGEAVSPVVNSINPPHIFCQCSQLRAYGGGPTVKKFDVLQPVGSSVKEMEYASSGDAAVLSQTTDMGGGVDATVILSGFSFASMDETEGWSLPVPARVIHLQDILIELGYAVNVTSAESEIPLVNRLENVYPNPFNPVTTIRYSIKERAHVSLRIYDVTGRLVKTLVNEEQSPQPGGYTASWNGTNNAGRGVSSGVYFCRLATRDHRETRKMVLLR
ncbi:MAG: T9SS type A sorting domain-containing protein [Candidatus Krumholzibacteriota bacterium]|nr:T9SS type A sorting domain-containing protein [Candidatus Krumholzibacteriota bacterium]